MRSLFVFISLLPSLAVAQQQAMYTQYMFNGLVINPAYAGTDDALSISALARRQWVGLEGAPSTQTVSAHAPIRSKNIGLGLTVSMDKIAVTRQTGVYGAYSYRIQVGSGYLSMGLQGGFSALKIDYPEVYTLGQDPAFQQAYSRFLPNVGAGIFYYNSLFYAGLSSPLLLENKIESDGVSVYAQRRHYFFTTGMVFRLSEEVKVKPNILVKAVDGSPVSVDYNVNFLLKEILWLGVSYRDPESINFLMELNVNKKFRIGYVYDRVIQKALKSAATSSHEILLNYRVSLTKKGVVSPRYF